MQSMTGYGEARLSCEFGELRAEIKCVNNRFSDTKLRLPSDLAACEIPLREHLKKHLGRGKIDASLRLESNGQTAPAVEINQAAADAYLSALQKLQDQWGVPHEIPWRELLNLPDVLKVTRPTLDPAAMEDSLRQALDLALEQVLEHRHREGEALRVALLEELDQLTADLEHIDQLRDQVTIAFRERLTKLVADIRRRVPESLDDHRLEAEIAIFADKADITEEIVRLRAHLEAFRQTVAEPAEKEVGKGLEFLTQEILREINTIGSKGRNTEIAAVVIRMKQSAEKIREQLANVR